MYKIKIKQGEETQVTTRKGEQKCVRFDPKTRQHNIVLVGLLRNPDGSKRRRKSAIGNMPITVITEN